MKIRLLAFFLTLFLTQTVRAQLPESGSPDYAEIKRATTKENSPLHFNALLSRFKTGDTTLSLGACRYLYYGYFFSPLFTESGGGSAWDSVRSYYSRDTLLPEEWKQVAHFAKLAGDTAPLDLRVLRAQKTANYFSGDTVEARKAIWKYDALVDAILSSGDGKTDTTAFHVITVNTEYALLEQFRFKSKGQSLTANLCDYLELADNKYGLKGIYFDVKQLFKVRDKYYNPTLPTPGKRNKKRG